MAKSASQFVCTQCGAKSPKWIGRCPSCGEWNSYVEEFEEKSPALDKEKFYSAPQKLRDISEEKTKRISSGIKDLDIVLGGGIVPSSLVLVGGDPGIGKSTLMTQMAGFLGKNHKVLYAGAEESAAQVKMRFSRLNIDGGDISVLNETSLENIEKCAKNYDFLIVDSIQAVYLDSMSSSAGSVSQVKECAQHLMRLAKNDGVTVFLIGHVTKEGALAGPKVLEHIMDTVLYFEGETTSNFRLLRSVKNRFGSANEVGVFDMTGEGLKCVEDYSDIFLSYSRGVSPGSVATPYMSGNRCVAVEIQCLTAKTVFGMPRRLPLGIDYNKMVLLLAVLEKRAGMPFYSYDVYLNAMGGIKLNEPSVDLAAIIACAGAYKNIPVDKYTAVFGEVGLTGEIRAVRFAEKRIKECIKLGFKKIILPKHNLKGLESYSRHIDLIGVNFIREALAAAFPLSPVSG